MRLPVLGAAVLAAVAAVLAVADEHAGTHGHAAGAVAAKAKRTTALELAGRTSSALIARHAARREPTTKSAPPATFTAEDVTVGDTAARPGGEDLPTAAEASFGLLAEENEMQPDARTQLLPDSDINKLTSIDCLEKHQAGNPHAPCGPKKQETFHDWSVGHYPKYQSTECNGNGKEKFCDPDNTLTATQRTAIMDMLHSFRQNYKVTCRMPGTGNEEKYPFGLGVALLKTLPSSELDEESLGEFGQSVLAEWGLLEERWCPNAAVLVLATEFQAATVSAASCEFICASRGGESIIVRMKANLDDLGKGDDSNAVFNAVKDGISEFKEVFKHLKPLAEQPSPEYLASLKPTLSPDTAEELDETEEELEAVSGGGPKEGKAPPSARKDIETYAGHKEATIILAQRFIVLLLLMVAAFTTFLMLCFACFGDFISGIRQQINDIAPWYIDPKIVPPRRAPTFGNVMTEDDGHLLPPEMGTGI